MVASDSAFASADQFARFLEDDVDPKAAKEALWSQGKLKKLSAFDHRKSHKRSGGRGGKGKRGGRR